MALSYAISALPAIATDASGDLLAIVDISDFTEAPTGTTKKVTVAQLFTNVSVTGTLAVSTNATIGGTLGVTGVTTFTTHTVVGSSTRIGTSGASGWYLGSNGTNRWEMTSAGHFAPFANSTYDLGISGQAVRNILMAGSLAGATTGAFSSNVTVGGTLGVTGVATMGVTSASALVVTGLINAPGGIAVGASNPASTGAIRLSNGDTVKMRNTANTADLPILSGVLNGIAIGDSSVDVAIGGSGGKVGFYGIAPVALATVTGSRGGNAALASLLTALNALGLVSNATTA